MTKSTRTLRTLAAAAGVVALIGTASACANASDDSEPERKSFALDGNELTIDSSDSKVVVKPADVDEIQVTRWFDGWAVFGDTPKATWSMHGHTLTFRTKCQGAVQDCSVRHEVLVPRGVRLTVVNGDGSVEASGFSTPLELTTGDGSVVVRDVTGPLRLSSGDGRIDAGGIRSREVSAHTSDGSVWPSTRCPTSSRRRPATAGSASCCPTRATRSPHAPATGTSAWTSPATTPAATS